MACQSINRVEKRQIGKFRRWLELEQVAVCKDIVAVVERELHITRNDKRAAERQKEDMKDELEGYFSMFAKLLHR